MSIIKTEQKTTDIIFSKSLKTGKRLYYIDVKKNRKEEMFIAITESKKIINNNDNPVIQFEKHKIFLYQEDFEKFYNNLLETMQYIQKNSDTISPVNTKLSNDSETVIEIEKNEVKI